MTKKLQIIQETLQILGQSDKVPLKYEDLKKIMDMYLINEDKEKKIKIELNSIEIFNIKENKCKNDKNNKIRESIICDIINNLIPEDYYNDNRWINLKTEIIKFLDELKSNYKNVKCVIKGGRKFNYDFEIIFDGDNKYIYKVEWKSNAECINDTPQFVSPMRPSQYMSDSYEEYYYDMWLPKLLNDLDFDMPNKEDYIKQIHSTNPDCMKFLQETYYKGCNTSSKFTNKKEDIDFYIKAKKISKLSIESFIKNTDLNYIKLTNYLLESQKNKYYMLYKDNKIHLQTLNIDNYKIISYIKKTNTYIATTETGFKITILLRWKNGNGIAFPAFQIS